VSTGAFVNFSKNPQLEFDIAGKIVPTGMIELMGDMKGTWQNMFGIRGLSLSNVATDIGKLLDSDPHVWTKVIKDFILRHVPPVAS
jgi:hypothetical protein